MNGIPYGWTLWAAANSATGIGVSGALSTFSSGAGPANGAVMAAAMVAANTANLLRLKAAYGPLTAAGAPVLATGAGYLGNGYGTAPAAVTLALAVLAHSARKVRAS